MSGDLRCCPFCGGPGSIGQRTDAFGKFDPSDDERILYRSECSQCRFQSPESEDITKAINWWNRRCYPARQVTPEHAEGTRRFFREQSERNKALTFLPTDKMERETWRTTLMQFLSYWDGPRA